MNSEITGASGIFLAALTSACRHNAGSNNRYNNRGRKKPRISKVAHSSYGILHVCLSLTIQMKT